MPKKEMTVENIILHHMAGDINQWLHQKGETISNYQNYLDRVCDIAEVLKGAIEKAKDSLLRYDPEINTVTIVDFPKGIKCGHCNINYVLKSDS
jgi:hypothetical protein